MGATANTGVVELVLRSGPAAKFVLLLLLVFSVVQLDAPAQAGERLWAGGKPVGVITSTAVSPRSGALAVGVVKRPYHEQGAELTAGEDRQRAVVI